MESNEKNNLAELRNSARLDYLVHLKTQRSLGHAVVFPDTVSLNEIFNIQVRASCPGCAAYIDYGEKNLCWALTLHNGQMVLRLMHDSGSCLQSAAERIFIAETWKATEKSNPETKQESLSEVSVLV